MSKSANDDTTPDTESYAYAWSKDSDVSLEDFLKKARVSLLVSVIQLTRVLR